MANIREPTWYIAQWKPDHAQCGLLNTPQKCGLLNTPQKSCTSWARFCDWGRYSSGPSSAKMRRSLIDCYIRRRQRQKIIKLFIEKNRAARISGHFYASLSAKQRKTKPKIAAWNVQFWFLFLCRLELTRETRLFSVCFITSRTKLNPTIRYLRKIAHRQWE